RLGGTRGRRVDPGSSSQDRRLLARDEAAPGARGRPAGQTAQHRPPRADEWPRPAGDGVGARPPARSRRERPPRPPPLPPRARHARVVLSLRGVRGPATALRERLCVTFEEAVADAGTLPRTCRDLDVLITALRDKPIRLEEEFLLRTDRSSAAEHGKERPER